MRRILFWSHLVVGAAAGVVILIMSVTGVLLTYQRQMTTWADRQYWGRATPSERAPASAIVASATAYTRQFAPEATLTSLVFRREAGAPVSTAIGRGRTLYLDPGTGQALGEGSRAIRTFFSTVTDIHRWLAMKDESRDTARKVTGAANLGFLLLVLSGIFLWMPRRWTWTQVRAVLWFKGGLRGKSRDFNWHHVWGIWLAIPLAIVVASGVVISYRWAGNLVYRIAGEEPPAQNGGAGAGGPAPSAREVDVAVIDAFTTRMFSEPGEWRTLTLTLPKPGAKRVAYSIDAGDGGQPQLRRTVAIDVVSGATVQSESFADQTPGRRARSILRFAHTGEVLGLPGQTVAGLASLAGAVLVWTGLALSLRRLAAWRRRANRESPAVAATPATVTGQQAPAV